MKKGWLLIPLIGVAAMLAWLLAEGKIDAARIRSALGIKSASAPSQAKSKPICSQVVVPAGDCIPQYLANLPPDPGPAGKLTIEGIDSDNDGVRDDVQRYIAERWGHSERAVKALTLVAKDAQRSVKLGDSVTRDEAYEIAKSMSPTARCYVLSVDPKIVTDLADSNVRAEVRNTKERNERYLKFDALTANRFYPMYDGPLTEACGYDPASLSN